MKTKDRLSAMSHIRLFKVRAIRKSRNELYCNYNKGTAPAGYVLRIEQAIGHCDGNIAKTELFRIRHTNSEGIVVYEKYQKMFKNGTIVVLD